MSGSLHLAQTQSNRGRQGRNRDFPVAERLVKRLVARELTLSFVPGAEQRMWRTVTRRKYQLTRDRVRLQNQLESLLEEAHIKLSSLISNLLGASARRMLKALADGETNPAALATLADKQLRATPEQLGDALGACTDLKPVYRRLKKFFSAALLRGWVPGVILAIHLSTIIARSANSYDVLHPIGLPRLATIWRVRLLPVTRCRSNLGP